MSRWWQKGIVYQIYPRSFQDTNGDGIGDLPGIIRRLNYLQWLGVDAIWISPIYPSPMADFGYDVSDYVNVHPMFGTLADMDRLIAAAHGRRLRVLLDLVPSHTSDQHPWFLESRASRHNPKRDWYIWRDAQPDGRPPNNWLSRFDGRSAWEWDEKTGQYYLHSFLAEQPDLNWRNPTVQAAMFDVMRFWFDRGVDGFRVDVVYRVMKDAQLRHNPPNPDWRPGMDPSRRLLETYSKNTPDSHQLNRWLRAVAEEYEDRVLLGEINLPLPALVKHYGDALDEFHLPQNLNLIHTPWEATAVRKLVQTCEDLLPAGAWPNWVLSNHDQPRVFSRVGAAQGRVALMLLLTLRGTPIMYYGDEIGMHDVEIPPEMVQDPWEIKTPGLGLGRDPERTPMQWGGSANAGFCPPDATPWLPLAEDADQNNVAVQKKRPDSVLTLVRRLIDLRRAEPALHEGSVGVVEAPEGVFAYVRENADVRFLVALNFTAESVTWDLPEGWRNGRIQLSTHLDAPENLTNGALTLRADEGVLLTVSYPTLHETG